MSASSVSVRFSSVWCRAAGLALVAVAALALLAGCATPSAPVAAVTPTCVAVRAAAPVKVDGKLDDLVWTKAPVYSLVVPAKAEPQEAGTAQFAWDDQNIYVAVRFTDSDVVQENDQDQQHHYLSGDLAELFLKPADETFYWELYANPNQRRTTFFLPGRGRQGLPSMEKYTCNLKIGAVVEGTLNNWRDRDQGWTAELAMPWADLAAQGAAVGPQSAWRVLVARYNYSRWLSRLELSSTPRLPARDYHLWESFAPLEFREP
ncbi:carbohydrate-binding family 9-like protein [bacterium]|nr:carbohydrate-binding family 9-like protein [bacterium]